MENTARVIHPEFAAGRRILAVSDIHGNLPFFRGLLQKVRFTPEDILVLDGDMLEKGRDSLALLRYMMELSRTHTVYPICGNCDGLVFRFLRRTSWTAGFTPAISPSTRRAPSASWPMRWASRTGWTSPACAPPCGSAIRRSMPGWPDCPLSWRRSTWCSSTGGCPPWSIWRPWTGGSA